MDQNVGDEVAPQIAGLTSAEVSERVAAGRINVAAGPRTKSVPQILAEHTLTLFNGVNVLFALLVALTGSWPNLAFLLIVFANLAIGVVQEVRSKRAVDRLTILATRPVVVRRSGANVNVAHDEVVIDDVVVLSRGVQVPADAQVVWGTAGLNESLLTGESEPVAKQAGDELMSGSFVDSGTVLARVTHVGADSYAARINSEAKYVKRPVSEIMLTLNMVIRFATWALAPIGLLLFWRTLADGSDINTAILTTVAALMGMIPQGLVLLTSTVLVIATARLARQNVLVQQFYCIEMLARVDVLCLDKTGTITSGSMDFSRAVPAEGHTALEVECAAASVAAADAYEANETASAILDHAQRCGIETFAATRSIAFSSARKYSGCVTSDGRALVMGASQFVLGEQSKTLDGLTTGFEPRERVLVVAEAEGFDAEGAIVGAPRLLGCISLFDHIRSTAPATIAFFKQQGVELKVISGDDARTVSSIAAEVGIPCAESFVDATTLTTPEILEHAVIDHHVFGRVTPQQKRELVQALQHQGHTVAMTGDGVNDVLALREADCSVAMASGSDAARTVAELVLVDNDFAHMPAVVAEGRRSINNLQRSASLFLVKTVFSAALALLCAVAPPYPFQPVQMSLISTAIIGVPSFVLALEPNHERVRGNFLANVLARSLPASLSIILAVGIASLTLEGMGLSRPEISTLCVLLTSLVGTCLIIRISYPLNAVRVALLLVVVLIMAFGCTVGRVFFSITPITTSMWVCFALIGTGALVVFNLLFNRLVAAASSDGLFLHLFRRVEKRNERRERMMARRVEEDVR